jgi:hypothetical protein
MLVVCPCGIKLNVVDTLLGKKVRCPICKDVFQVREEEGNKKGGFSASEDPMPSRQRQPLPTQQKKARAVEEDDSFEEADEEQPRSFRKQGQGVTSRGSTLGLLRNILASVVLCALLIVLGWVAWARYTQPGTVLLEVNVLGTTVFADGKQIELTEGDMRVGHATLTLSPGDHEIKVTKEGFQPYVKQINVPIGSSNSFEVQLKAEAPTKQNAGFPPGDIAITATALIHELDFDNAVANQKYVGRFLVVSGLVHSINKVRGRAPGLSVVLTGDKGIDGGYVACQFDNPPAETVARIKLGEQIKVRGQCKGTGLKSMGLSQVNLVEP